MIDLHTHSILSDGGLLPSELVRRAQVMGYEAIAITDHVDMSNIDFVVPRLVKVCRHLNSLWDIRVIAGVEITHAPLQDIAPLAKYARNRGAMLVVVHGETLAEPVICGTNRRAIECKADILAHPGNISREDALLAKENGVYLELSARKIHNAANAHVARTALDAGAKLIINTDAHQPEDLVTDEQARQVAKEAGLNEEQTAQVFENSRALVERFCLT